MCNSKLYWTLSYCSFYNYWVCFHFCLTRIPIEIASSAVGLKTCAITAGIKKYKSIIKKKKLFKNIYLLFNNLKSAKLFGFLHQSRGNIYNAEAYLQPCQTSTMETFGKREFVNYFRKKAPSKIFDSVLIIPLRQVTEIIFIIIEKFNVRLELLFKHFSVDKISFQYNKNLIFPMLTRSSLGRGMDWRSCHTSSTAIMIIALLHHN